MGSELAKVMQKYSVTTPDMSNNGPVYMSAGGSAADAIRSYYSSLLGREADPEGLSYWQQRANEGLSLADIQGAFLNSPEYANRETILRTYANNLGSTPSPQVVSSLLGSGQTGGALAAVAAAQMSEAERVASINAAYQKAFGREAEQVGVDWWLKDWDKLTADGSIQDDILRGALNADRDAAINRLGYQDLLGREAEKAGIEFWTRPDIYKEITEGGLEDLRASVLAGAQNEDAPNAVKRSFELMFGRQPAPDELAKWMGDYKNAALQGLRNPIAESAMGDDRQRLVYNADVGMFNAPFTLNKSAGEVFRDYVYNKPENALDTSTYYNRGNIWDTAPTPNNILSPTTDGWKNPNVVPDDYFKDQYKSTATGVGDLTWGFQGTGGFTPEQFKTFEDSARVGSKTTQNLLDERFGVDGKPGNFAFADVSVPPLPGSLGPGSLGGTGSNRVWAGTGKDMNYIPSYLQDGKGGYTPPPGGWSGGGTGGGGATAPLYGFELNNLMRQYGVTSPTATPAALSSGQPVNMYNRAQFMPQMNQNLGDMYNKYARGGAVKTRYAEGGEVEDPETERSNRGPMTPEGAARMAALLGQMMPTTNYGAQLAGAQQNARSETEAFSNMIRQMSERAESPTSRAEMYFRLASAFGAPTRTGQFTENLGLAGREMGEYARGRRTDEAERRALALRAQELRMAGARQDLASLQTLAGQESAERRAINARIIEAQIRANTPSARERRINDMMETYNIDRQTAARIVDNVESVIADPVTGMPQIVNRMTGVSRSATPRPAEESTAPVTGEPAAAPAPAGATAPTTSAPRGPAGESARPQRTLYELASVPRTTGMLPAIGEGAQRIAGQVGANVVPPEFTERRQAFLNVQNEIIRAVINNPRFPVAEQERIRRELNIEPAMFTDPQTLLARIRTLDSTLRTSLANREREGADTSLPVDVRRGALQAANEARNLLQILGVPQGGEEPAPAPRPRRRDSLQRPRAPQQEGWSIQPVE